VQDGNRTRNCDSNMNGDINMNGDSTMNGDKNWNSDRTTNSSMDHRHLRDQLYNSLVSLLV
jgi:hypothetical protein